jgi:hypothetical protein
MVGPTGRRPQKGVLGLPDGDGQAPGGVDRLLEHLDSYFLVAELVAGEWLALLCAAGLATHDGGVFTAMPGLEDALDPERLGFNLTVLLEMTELWPRLMPALSRSLATGCGAGFAKVVPHDSPAGLTVYAATAPA